LTVTTTGIFRFTQMAAESLACCPTWKGVVGAVTDQEGLDHVYVDQGAADDYPVPRCGVCTAEGFAMDMVGTSNCWQPSAASVGLFFSLPVPERTESDEMVESDEDAIAWLKVIVGSIIEEMQDNFSSTNPWRGTVCHFWFSRVVVLDDAYLEPLEEREHDPEQEQEWNQVVASMAVELVVR